jgi:GNAT superfamily N-acetyltransferase
MRIERVPEPELTGERAAQVGALLRACFDGYPDDRPYFKLPPHQRLLALRGEAVVGQVGLELRAVRVGDEVLRAFAVVDLCVDPAARSQGLAGRLLGELLRYAERCEIDVVLLFADDHRLYERHGWALVDNRVSWLKVHEHRTLGLAEREPMGDALMVRAVGDRAWPAGDVDLLGHLS